jgi:hypothetical protein
MELGLKLRTCLIAGALIAAGVVADFASAQAPQPQDQNPPGQQPTQPTQPQQPTKSPDDKNDKPYEDHLPTPPVVAGTSNDAPLTGASQPIIGLVASRSYIAPSVYFFGQLDTNGSNLISNAQFTSINTIMGSIAVQKMGRASQLNLGYLAGRSFSNRGGVLNSTTHEAAASELWSRGRWDGFILDKFMYSSEASFLGGATPFDISGLNTVAGLADTGPVILRNSFQPGQGIFTTFGPRLSNSLVGQVNNHLSRRLFFTMVGDYSILHFYNSALTNLPVQDTGGFNLISSSTAGFQAGMGYQRSRRDTFAVVYRFTDLWFTGFPVTIRDNVIEGAYQRQVGERLLFQAGAGPEISFLHSPVLGGSTTLNSETRVSWTVDTLVHYQLTRVFGVSAGYDHFLSSGSGVFLGAITDRVFVGLDRQVSRAWTMNISASYAHNQNLIPLFSNGVVQTPASATFDSIYGGVEMRRRIGHDSQLFFGYLGRYQTSSFVLCPQGICTGKSLVGHQFNFGFAWHLKPVPIG